MPYVCALSDFKRVFLFRIMHFYLYSDTISQIPYCCICSGLDFLRWKLRVVVVLYAGSGWWCQCRRLLFETLHESLTAIKCKDVRGNKCASSIYTKGFHLVVRPPDYAVLWSACGKFRRIIFDTSLGADGRAHPKPKPQNRSLEYTYMRIYKFQSCFNQHTSDMHFFH